MIHAFDLVEWDDADPARPIAVVDVACSAGTYVRSLARDLGAHLGTGAYLGALVRTASGGFRLEDAIALDDLRAHAGDGPAGVERDPAADRRRPRGPAARARSPTTRSGGSGRG